MRHSSWIITAFWLMGAPGTAFASLGDAVSSIDRDGQALQAKHVSLPGGSSYSLHQLSTTTMNINEYVTADGKVFAMTWQGVKRPDLSVLLGTYYQEYSSAKALIPKVKGRHPATVKSANAVVIGSGHMRDIRGRAYLPGLVPAGVNVEALK